MLKILSVEDSAPVVRERNRWYRTPNPWRMDRARIEHLTRQREDEWRQIQAYVSGCTCLMRFLANALDDGMEEDCGKCALCAGRALISEEVRPQTFQAAQRLMRRSEMVLEPKKQWPAGEESRWGFRSEGAMREVCGTGAAGGRRDRLRLDVVDRCRIAPPGWQPCGLPSCTCQRLGRLAT